MILLVDAGNSRIKWAMMDSGLLVHKGVCATSDAISLEAAWGTQPLHQVLISCVAGQAVRIALTTAFAASNAKVRWLYSDQVMCGLSSNYLPPDSLGSDRYAALVAARQRNLGACLIVSAGTALTVDALSESGHFLGGCIVPGADLMRSALSFGTAAVRTFGEVVETFPTNTGDAVATGVTLAQVGLVCALFERLKQASLGPATVLLTGGGRSVLRGRLPKPVIETEDLVLEGMAWIAKELQWEDG